ncbi:hypothetical protein BJY04DRAFT_204162 [Aspergillus karnatakaensis]|uniref:uncharacterized protein n=1 Tax=Aspergillus karnatakaensis TaxID=1810916 RepID=UPI003CCE43FC
MPRPSINLEPYREEISHLYRTNISRPDIAWILYNRYGIQVSDATIKLRLQIWDALDECKEGRSDLLSLISKAVSIQPAHLKWIVSSRNERLIEQGLNLDNDRSKLSLELNAHHISLAIQKFINHKASDLDILKDDQRLRDRVKDQLYQKSDGTFLWVALVVNELADCDFEDEVLEALERFQQIFQNSMIE